MPYDLAVAYRVYSGMSSSPPPIFADNKFKMAELCLNSFKAALGDLRVRVYALLDKCPPVYEELFKRLWPAEDLTITHYPGIGNRGTLAKQIYLLGEQTDAEIVYFAEDDYFYLPGQFPLAVNFMRENGDVHFVSPYDHLDHYTTELHDGPTETRAVGGKEWKPSLSTTGTFLTTRATVRESQRILLTLTQGNTDLGMWMALKKQRVFNPFNVVRWLVPHRFWAGSVLFAWYYCWRQILFGRRYTLWIPRPSIGTHLVAGLEAPGIDWQKEFQLRIASGPPAV